ncbi:MAG: iron-sulfur cluster repair di-iron protein [Planctomycetota bacterium]|nr:iron-sulfur cluster repair di-iron protein [Planctomycetota bacterium]
MQNPLDLSVAVGMWVRESPLTSRIFERMGIDYCCGGQQSLEDACRKHNLDPQIVANELQAALSEPADCSDEHFASLSQTEMCDRIVATHHEFLKSELPRLTKLLAKVRHVHGGKYQWLGNLDLAFTRLREELVPHMFKEEHVLFPAIRSLEQSSTLPAFPFGSIDNPIHMMEHEHSEAGAALEQIRQATSDFSIPADACNTCRALLDGLRELQSDLHIHIHKENNILFPMASQMAASMQGKL